MTTTLPLTTKAPLPSDVRYILIADFAVVIVALCLHIVGILLLLRRRWRQISTQNILLIHLSLVSIINIATNTTAIAWKFQQQRFSQDFIVAYYIAHMAYILNLMLLATDRCVYVLLPLLYHRHIHVALLIIGLLVTWSVSVVFGLLIKYTDMDNAWFYSNASYVYNGFVICYCALAYLIIAFKVHLSKKENSSGNSPTKKAGIASVKSRKLVVVSFLIVFTFFLFAFLPHLIIDTVSFENKHTHQLLTIGLIGVNVLNNVSDPIIYIFLQPMARRRLSHVVRNIKIVFSRHHTDDIATVHYGKKNGGVENSFETNVDVVYISPSTTIKENGKSATSSDG